MSITVDDLPFAAAGRRGVDLGRDRCLGCAASDDQLGLQFLEALGAGMEARDRLPQIELAIGGGVTALVLRHLEPLSAHDAQCLRDFAATHGVQWWLQPKGPDTVRLLDEGGPELAYTLPEFGITMPFKPTDFTQVNHQINTVLVGRAVRLLDPQASERVIDGHPGRRPHRSVKSTLRAPGRLAPRPAAGPARRR